MLIAILLCPSAFPIDCTAVASLFTWVLTCDSVESFAFATKSITLAAVVSMSEMLPVLAPVGYVGLQSCLAEH